MTSNLETRFAQHLSCNGENPRKDAWIQTPGVEVDKAVIETRTSFQEAKERETHWINHYLRQGMPLTNQFIPSLTPKPSSRDTKRYAYFTMGIPRGSETLEKLRHDAEEMGMQDAIARLLAVRIADFYRQTNTAIPTRTIPSQPIEAPPETINEDMAALNAQAALDEWG